MHDKIILNTEEISLFRQTEGIKMEIKGRKARRENDKDKRSEKDSTVCRHI
jgi:hypothetical protein